MGEEEGEDGEERAGRWVGRAEGAAAAAIAWCVKRETAAQHHVQQMPSAQMSAIGPCRRRLRHPVCPKERTTSGAQNSGVPHSPRRLPSSLLVDRSRAEQVAECPPPPAGGCHTWMVSGLIERSAIPTSCAASPRA